MKMTLRLKTMLILVVTVVVSLGGSGLFFLQHFENAFRASVYETLNSVARENANSLADYMHNQTIMLKHIASVLPANALGIKDYVWVESYLEDHGQDFDSFANGFFHLDEKGVLRADFPAHPENRGKNYSFRPYFKSTMGEKHGVISAPYRSARTGEVVITFTVYLASRDQHPLGLLGGSILLLEDPDLKRIREQKIGQSGYLFVFNQSRMMILHPDEKRILARDVAVGVNRMFDAAIDGFEGAAETVNSKGVAMFVAFHQVPGTDWIVAAQQPVAEALKPLAESQRPLILFMVLGSLLAAGLGMLMVHRSMRGLSLLEDVTAQLAIPDENNHQLEAALQAEAGKLFELSNHVEFGPLAVTISELYTRLGLALLKTRQMTNELDEAYQQLKMSQSQILQQEKMASIGQLAAGVAHEINNPMGFISSNLVSLGRYFEKLLAYIDLLEGWALQAGDDALATELADSKKKLKIEYLREDIPDLISESCSGSDRVRDIVQNLKSFSRVDQAERSYVNLNDCLESTIAIAWNEIKYNATLERDFSELPELNCYSQQLNQVFLNILVNAAQAIKEKGVVTVKTWAEESVIKVAISDDGCGIPLENQKRIFEPFFTTKDVGEGTGLGMSISYDIIKKHNGEILLDSTVGQGTTFTIVLPYSGEGEENG